MTLREKLATIKALCHMNNKGMAPIVALFLGLGTVIIVSLVIVLLAGVVDGQMGTLFTTFNVSNTWITIKNSLVSMVSAAMNIGGLGILVFAFVVILAILGVGIYSKR